jgi:DNA-binding transcriptional LysR family regulator
LRPLLALVGAGVGVGVVPGGATRGPLVRGLRFIPLAEPKLVRRLGLIALREREAHTCRLGLHGVAAPRVAEIGLMQIMQQSRLSG